MLLSLLAAAAAAAAGAPRPHIVMILADDLGWYDTALHNPKSPTPRLKELAAEGMLLDRHYVFRYCSPTRRALLSGRFPNHITSVQPDGSGFCSDFLPLATTTLAQKLSSGGYEAHFIGKGHLGYQTVDHLPINRGFKTHVGYLNGAEKYEWGGGKEDPTAGSHDMWHDRKPGSDIVPLLYYSANVYSDRAVSLISQHNLSVPLYLHLMYQNVHSPYEMPPAWECGDFPDMWDATYANMLHTLDVGIGNVTGALRARPGTWEHTLLVFSADNGGIGDYGNNHPLRGHKHDPWEGGTRAAAFISGGFVPAPLRGTTSGNKLVHVTDWYPTFCRLAGVDPADDVVLGGKVRPIDGVDVWPLLTGSNLTQPRPATPTTEVSIIDASAAQGPWWKLVTLAGDSVYYTPDAKQLKPNTTCLAGRQPDPPMPGRTDALVSGCPVCNATAPCLFDVLADPSEQANVAAQHPDVVARLTAALAGYNHIYASKSLPDDVLAANYSKLSDPRSHWGGYLGPCYLRQ
eukprot:TRINITY_DN3205_c0_g1_i1.p1 TRINITY_DN3205_c0_g1~~TRINITY_DN3205_c0_g1_i1.p1  ORF type:complete len:545 (+),score=180.56 TRINITY_DN3205_c0_g1_i1:90-1637(+)